MSRAAMAPGQDSGGSSAKGVFAEILQGSTPKYAVNAGARRDLFRNTLARMFVRVDATEMNVFLASIGDPHTRTKLASAIAGDPAPQQPNQAAGGGSTGDATVARRRSPSSNGYLDFLIQSVQMGLQEKVQVDEALSDNYVAFTFGQSPPMWNFTGVLINSVQDDQASNMFRLYTQILRATQMARRQKSMSLSFDSYVVNGVMTNLNMSLASNNELMVPFSFQLLVKRVFVTNFSAGWVPTRAGTPFAADLHAIAYDGRPREESALSRIVARTPPGTQLAPTPQNQEHPAVNGPSGVNNGTAAPSPRPGEPGYQPLFLGGNPNMLNPAFLPPSPATGAQAPPNTPELSSMSPPGTLSPRPETAGMPPSPTSYSILEPVVPDA